MEGDGKKVNFLWYGGDYNPDQWDEETVKRDMELFKKANVNLVVLPVFSWAKLEPEEGVYQFDWLDRILEILQENQIHVCLANSTAAQPAWLSIKYPEVLPVDISGRRRTHGMRMFFCVNSEIYRQRAAALTEQFARRYKAYPYLAAWHVANEYGTYCYCEQCQKKFREWLQDRYQTVTRLNEKWNTSFWGRTLFSFDEVMLPTELNDDYRFAPAVQLDYLRFMTHSTRECYLNEAEILQRYTPDIPVFSNISGFIKKLDQFALTEVMDYAAWDNYPGPADDPSFPALKHDLMRGLKGGKPFLVAEQAPNQQNWQSYNKLKRPGQLRTIAYQGIGHGAESCLYFQMRQSVGGQEKFHSAMISHSGREDTRIFQEMTRLGGELEKISAHVLGAKVHAPVGILFDWENWWALELASGPTADMDYLPQVHKYYRPFYRHHAAVDLIRPDRDFSQYKILVAPLLYMLKDGVARRLTEFVRQGGTLIATYMTGVADENDRCVFGAYPGPLRELFGLWVEETDAMYPQEKNEMICTAGQKSYSCGFLCDVVRVEEARVLAVYGKDFYQGQACVTVNDYGKGKAYYLGTEPDDEFLNSLVGEILAGCKAGAPFLAPENVEICIRHKDGESIFFVINHQDRQTEIDLGKAGYWELLSGRELTGKVSLADREVLVLKYRKETSGQAFK